MLLYPSIKKILLSLALGLAGQFIPYIGGLLSFISLILLLVAMHEMKSESQRLYSAYRAQLYSLALMLGGVFISFLALYLTVLVWIGLLMLVIGTVYSIYSEYCLYRGLDEQVMVRNLEYPQGKLMYCFYLTVARMLASVVVSVFASLVTQFSITIPSLVNYLTTGFACILTVLQLWLLFDFFKSVQSAEGR